MVRRDGEPAAVGELLAAAREVVWRTDSPLHLQIAGWLDQLMNAGALAPGQKLPAERALAQALGVSRMTLRQGLETLQNSGRLIRTIGSRGGAVVADRRSTVDISDLIGVRRQLLRTARTATSLVVSARTLTVSPGLCDPLDVPEGAQVHEIVRVRYSDEVPVVLERSYFPAAVFPALVQQDLTGSIYAVMQQHYGLAPSFATQELVSMLAGAENARLLGVSPQTPVLGVIRTASAGTGLPVEFSRDVFRSDRLRVTVSGRIHQDVETGPAQG